MKSKLKLKQISGYILIFSTLCFAFYRGKKQAQLECIDFNILPIIDNTITITICTILSLVGIWLMTKSKLYKTK
ncbi:hypothetical protein [Winogradskyella haliclonae]|uniref:DUF3955 domain-containing protein n=1 Tax=Winogradskyella haliclonae TaxID=2048558 RepID=A0ABQ2BWZ0_9FLAO|nr:hypothetical protein [Winogradskyella haliclonae]GGI57019.1 hypothetical protein GCM10011444_13280 [Winogradskyella haliclonae]